MKWVEYLIRHLKNPEFTFDEALDLPLLLSLLWTSACMMLRGVFRFPLRARQVLMLGRRVSFVNRHRIRMGRAVKLDDYCHVAAVGTGHITIGNCSAIGAFSRLIISSSYANLGSEIHIGRNVGIGEFSYIGGAGGTRIGNNCIIGQYFSTHPENHIFSDAQQNIRMQGVTRSGIELGDNIWVGAKVTILDGVRIGHSCVIAAGSVVRAGDYPPYVLLAGVPARIIKRLDTP